MKRVIKASIETPNRLNTPCPHCDNQKYVIAIEIFLDLLKAMSKEERFEILYEPSLYDPAKITNKHSLTYSEINPYTGENI